MACPRFLQRPSENRSRGDSAGRAFLRISVLCVQRLIMSNTNWRWLRKPSSACLRLEHRPVLWVTLTTQLRLPCLLSNGNSTDPYTLHDLQKSEDDA